MPVETTINNLPDPEFTKIKHIYASVGKLQPLYNWTH